MIALMDDINRWDKDNSEFVINELMPELKLSMMDKMMLRWAYGEDQSCRILDLDAVSYEILSDGETLVEDWFLDAIIKNPAGVVHDYGNRVPHHITPDMKKWSATQLNALYRRVTKALWLWDMDRKKKDLNWLTGTMERFRGFRLRWRRWLGVTVSSMKWYRRS